MHNRIRQHLTSSLPDAIRERLTMDCRAEVPGPDGIRHKLVARIKAEIAAGTYDTEERWLAAEKRLLNQLDHAL
ncbi:MAG: flagellar biosynthesis anti-sigma factor FlgM [Gemmataceae bacterium]